MGEPELADEPTVIPRPWEREMNEDWTRLLLRTAEEIADGKLSILDGVRLLNKIRASNRLAGNDWDMINGFES
jgi:hypothetical protein